MASQRASRPSVRPSPLPSIAPRASLLPSSSVHLHSVLLSGVAGYVDAAGFASLVGLLPAHVTGELVSDAIALFSSHARTHVHLWVLPVFLGSVVLATFVARVLRRRGERPLAGLLLLITAALALFSASDPLARLVHATGNLPLLLSGGFAVVAMGFQNALMRESLITSCPTTVMTGNLTQVVVDLADRALGKIFRPHPNDRKPRSRLGPVSAALGSFVCCAVLGGWLTHRFGSWGAILPTCATAFLAVRAWREDRARLAQVSSLVVGAPPRVPTFGPAHVWPESLMPESGGARGPAEPTSITQIRSAPGIPPLPTAPKSPSPRLPAERRTISGTQPAQHFRDDDDQK